MTRSSSLMAGRRARCPTCNARVGAACTNSNGKATGNTHVARMRASRRALLNEPVPAVAA